MNGFSLASFDAGYEKKTPYRQHIRWLEKEIPVHCTFCFSQIALSRTVLGVVWLRKGKRVEEELREDGTGAWGSEQRTLCFPISQKTSPNFYSHVLSLEAT